MSRNVLRALKNEFNTSERMLQEERILPALAEVEKVYEDKAEGEQADWFYDPTRIYTMPDEERIAISSSWAVFQYVADLEAKYDPFIDMKGCFYLPLTKDEARKLMELVVRWNCKNLEELEYYYLELFHEEVRRETKDFRMPNGHYSYYY